LVSKKGFVLFLHFDNENTTRIDASDPMEVYDMIRNHDSNWLKIDDKLINLSNITYITSQKKTSTAKGARKSPTGD
jgi:hypothetical protein